MQTSEVRRETGVKELIAIFSPSDFSPAKTLSVLQPASFQAKGIVEVCSLESAIILTHAEVKCLLPNGSGRGESTVIAYIDEKLESLSGSGFEQLAKMSERVTSFGRAGGTNCCVTYIASQKTACSCS